MATLEQMQLCNKCRNVELHPEQETICRLTNKAPDFVGECKNFELDETVEEELKKEELEREEQEKSEEIMLELNEDDTNKLRYHQNFNFAIIGGLVAAIISAILWAIISVTTEYQIGYMAIGVGFLVGLAVKFFGAGIEMKFGLLGAGLALTGCLLGNLFSLIGFEAQYSSLGYFEILALLEIGIIVDALIAAFQPIDLLFYGLAIYTGYKVAFRKVTSETISKLKSDNYDGLPSNHKLRKPLFIGGLVLLLLFFLKISEGTSGHEVIRYESGQKLAEGDFVNNKENGKWTVWHENGEISSIGYYINGFQDSVWQWFNESGQLVQIGNYAKGLAHGLWMDYTDDGSLIDSGYYADGRMDGSWTYWFENGNLASTAYYKKNLQHGIQTDYYENGQIISVGRWDGGKMIGDWKTYYSTGQKALEIEYTADEHLIINNSWDLDGKQIVKDGNGFYKHYLETGEVIQSGKVENGIRVGTWYNYYENGNPQATGYYENEIFRIIDCWDLRENLIVKDGNGSYESYYPVEFSVLERGRIKNGYRDGKWQVYSENFPNLFQELVYIEGKLTGLQKNYSFTGKLESMGEMVDGLREGEWNWYWENGNIWSTVNYKKDKKEGKQTMWDESGLVIKEEYFKDGELVEENN
ncbi:MAG: hypothetical protein HKM87_09305 [Ignavibacteriaceae bacterium]|nr:hypothetical protein [Ignavibacteriaceae bacterium]